jgi:hypothetical protein
MKQEPGIFNAIVNAIVKLLNNKWPLWEIIIAIVLLVVLVAIIFNPNLLSLLHFKSNDNNQNMASSNSAPGTGIAYSSNVSVNSGNVSQNVGSSNSGPVTAIANSSNVSVNSNNKINIGVTHEDIALIQEGMRAAEEKQNARLKQMFPLGYYVFTFTMEAQHIFVLDRKVDQELIVTDWSPCSIACDRTNITIRTPKMIVVRNGRQIYELGGDTIIDPIGIVLTGGTVNIETMTVGTLRLVYLKDNINRMIYALGIDPSAK